MRGGLCGLDVFVFTGTGQMSEGGGGGEVNARKQKVMRSKFKMEGGGRSEMVIQRAGLSSPWQPA